MSWKTSLLIRSHILALLVNTFSRERSVYEVDDDLQLNMNSRPTLKALFKYKNHPSIISIRRFLHQLSNFFFFCIDENTVLKESRGLSTTKASQDTDLPVKILKEKADYFAKFICIQFNDSVNYSNRSDEVTTSFGVNNFVNT